MKLMVPTLWVMALCATPLALGGKTAKAGEVIRVPYGVGLQGLATGAFAAIEDADAMHAQAVEYLDLYGPDSWFPAAIQTIQKFWNYVEGERKKNKEGVTQVDGETVH
jgi:hypothetical protein